MIRDGAINDGRPPGSPNYNPKIPGDATQAPAKSSYTGAIPNPQLPGMEPLAGPTSIGDELVVALGLPLTRHNPVWGPFALDKLRELQHVLMKHAFTQTGDQRQVVLDAVKTVELSVTLRIRFEEAAQQEALQQQQEAARRAPTSPTATAPSLVAAGATA
jgi:hypothetical protein